MILGLRALASFHAWRSGFWLRIPAHGHGVHVCVAASHRMMFSERYGFTKALYVFGLRFEHLQPAPKL